MRGNGEKVVVAMSGGVDSSVAACLLVKQGYEVIGLFMRVGAAETVPEPPTTPPCEGGMVSPATSPGPSLASRGIETSSRAHQGCCSASDAADARFVAGMLGIPFYALNFQADFDKIIDYFADEYVNGRTPNPCVVCNDKLKFGKLVDYADAVGANYIATGHYARIGERRHSGGDGLENRSCMGADRPARQLMRGLDEKKDQSYVLFGLDRAILDRVLFPVGELTKHEVRELAARYNLPNRDKPDSVEICFVPDRNYARVVKGRRPEAFVEGEVVDCDGVAIGRHRGVANYTIGQRRGLGIAVGKPIYVTQLNVVDNRVVMGDGDDLLAVGLVADRGNFLVDRPDGPFRARVKIRYLHRAAPATVELLQQASSDGGSPAGAGGTERIRVMFDEPQRAVTPGQAVVFYEGDVVLGGAWIERPVSGTGANATVAKVGAGA